MVFVALTKKTRNFPAFWLRVAIRADQIDRQTGYLVVNSFPTASVGGVA